MDYPIDLKSWKQVSQYAQDVPVSPLNDSQYYVEGSSITLDFSGQRINKHILEALLNLAKESNLSERIEAQFAGHPINSTEFRPALHTALRACADEVIHVHSRNVVADVLETRQHMKIISDKIRNGTWLGRSGAPIKDIVNIGIGGSMLGPLFCINALQDYVTEHLRFHFISEIDPKSFLRLSKKLNPETTLFIVSSKSFTTPETLFNFKKALAWMSSTIPDPKHFIAVSSNLSQAQSLGFATILPIWDWVGGRYSLCSAINLISCIAIGYEHFSSMLAGAHSMDQHFKNTEHAYNLPILLALLGIWNINFLKCNNLLVLSYSEDLHYFAPYLQQLDMESNGKSVNKQNESIKYDSGPLVWGGAGNQAQHSYYQWLCQGTHQVAADLICVSQFNDEAINQVCLGHRTVLTQGIYDSQDLHQTIKGKIPVNLLSLMDCTPKSIGALVALYEHKVFVQGVIWNINSFDQPGVECAKKQIHLT